MVLNICNFIQRTEQVPIELDISAIEDYILLYNCVLCWWTVIMPYRQYSIGHVLYSEHYNFPVYIITYWMFSYYVYVYYVLWFAYIMFIPNIYL